MQVKESTLRFTRFMSRRRATWLAIAGLAALGMASAGAPSSIAAGTGPSDWPMFGQNLNNTASTPSSVISQSNVSALKPKWAFTTGGDVSARAAVSGGVAYFPDWSGHLYAITSSSGKLVWSKNIGTDYLHGVL